MRLVLKHLFIVLTLGWDFPLLRLLVGKEARQRRQERRRQRRATRRARRRASWKYLMGLLRK